MRVHSFPVHIDPFDGRRRPFDTIRAVISSALPAGTIPLRLAVTGSGPQGWKCEVEAGVPTDHELPELADVLAFRERGRPRTGSFNAVMLVPTGIDCSIGGHAGDATPAARMLASVCDRLVLHPNVVNASDINEMPDNALYVEGSVIAQLMMGTVGLREVRRNRILTVTEARDDGDWTVNQVVNVVNGARATLGIDSAGVVVLDQALSMKAAYTDSGRATGDIGGFDTLLRLLREREGTYDAVALATRIEPPMDSVTLHHNYFHGEGANPWGGVEAVLTHAVSSALGVPSAHAPTMSDLTIRTEDFGQVEPRKAAEIFSVTYLYCVMKGLHRSPALTEPSRHFEPGVLQAEDIDALVIPDGALGVPVLAALAQGIPVITVSENTNLMRNELSDLPWAPGQLLRARSYAEAAGLLASLRAGVALDALYRPMQATPVERYG